MTRQEQHTRFAAFEEDDKPPFTFPPAEREPRPQSSMPWLRVLFIVVGTTAVFAYLYLNHAPQLLALVR